MPNTSPKKEIDINDLTDIVKVMAWSFGSAILAGLLHLVSSGDLPTQLIWLAPALNTFLVGAHKWWQDNNPPR